MGGGMGANFVVDVSAPPTLYSRCGFIPEAKPRGILRSYNKIVQAAPTNERGDGLALDGHQSPGAPLGCGSDSSFGRIDLLN